MSTIISSNPITYCINSQLNNYYSNQKNESIFNSNGQNNIFNYMKNNERNKNRIYINFSKEKAINQLNNRICEGSVNNKFKNKIYVEQGDYTSKLFNKENSSKNSLIPKKILSKEKIVNDKKNGYYDSSIKSMRKRRNLREMNDKIFNEKLSPINSINENNMKNSNDCYGLNKLGKNANRNMASLQKIEKYNFVNNNFKTSSNLVGNKINNSTSIIGNLRNKKEPQDNTKSIDKYNDKELHLNPNKEYEKRNINKYNNIFFFERKELSDKLKLINKHRLEENENKRLIDSIKNEGNQGTKYNYRCYAKRNQENKSIKISQNKDKNKKESKPYQLNSQAKILKHNSLNNNKVEIQAKKINDNKKDGQIKYYEDKDINSFKCKYNKRIRKFYCPMVKDNKIEVKLDNNLDIDKILRKKFDYITIENNNINLEIKNKMNNKNYKIIKNNEIELKKENPFLKSNKNNEIILTIINKVNENDDLKLSNKLVELSKKEIKNKNNIILFNKKQNEVNNEEESIQKNYEEKCYNKGNNNYIVERKEYGKKKTDIKEVKGNESDTKILIINNEREIKNKNNQIEECNPFENDDYINEKKNSKNYYYDDEFNINNKNKKNLKKLNKIYGFKNRGNNCYLNSSLQLLTRIDDLKEKTLNFEDINKDNITKGKLIKEFKKILNDIEKAKDDNLVISPEDLKKVMANVDEKYGYSGQEDANEFISLFINTLLSETANKNKVMEKMEIYDEKDRAAFDKFYRKFYVKKGYSYLLELFYGIIRSEKICNNCGESNLVNFSSFNMLDLPIYNLVKSKRNKRLDLRNILNQYFSEKKNTDFTCIKCNEKNIFTKTIMYSLPKYLIIFFGRIVENIYLYNYIDYPEEFNFNEYVDNKIILKNNNSYKLECVIEHSGGTQFGHYTSLCPMSNNCWYRFSDSYGNIHNEGYKSNDAIILLYKAK